MSLTITNADIASLKVRDKKEGTFMNIIAVVNSKWGIGANGKLLYHIPQDMSFFKQKTMGKTIVMGRKTFESLPGNHLLTGRKSIVLSKNTDFKPEGAEVFSSVDGLLKRLEKENSDNVFVIGGGEIYSALLPYCNRAYITKVQDHCYADVFMPDLDKNPHWEAVAQTREFLGHKYLFSFVTYERSKSK